ncbi:MAG: hypothetical protein RL693_870 [Verrucomicrobiota bacterium]|jgi:hypothetical protein
MNVIHTLMIAAQQAMPAVPVTTVRAIRHRQWWDLVNDMGLIGWLIPAFAITMCGFAAWVCLNRKHSAWLWMLLAWSALLPLLSVAAALLHLFDALEHTTGNNGCNGPVWQGYVLAALSTAAWGLVWSCVSVAVCSFALAWTRMRQTSPDYSQILSDS